MPRREEPQVGLAKAIRQLRREGQLSQEALGLIAGIHPTWISHIESGRVNPTWGNVRRIAGGLRVALPELAALAEDLEAKYRNRPPARRRRGAVENILGVAVPNSIPRRSAIARASDEFAESAKTVPQGPFSRTRRDGIRDPAEQN